MFKRLSIRQNIIAGILIGCLLPFTLGSLLIKNQTEKWLYENYVDHTGLILLQTADSVDQSIDHIKGIANEMIHDDLVQSACLGGLTSYLTFDPQTFERNPSEAEKNVVGMFHTATKTEKDFLSYVALGAEDGGYAEYPEFHPTKPYDPRGRDWYVNAMNSEGPVISEPYQMQISKNLVISIDQRVVQNDKKVGVISLTVSLDKIMQKIEAIPYKQAGSIVILSPNDVFIYSAENDDWLMKSVDELELDVLKNIDRYNGKYFEGKLNGEDKVFTVYISPESGWKYISIMDQSLVLEQSKSLSKMLGYIFLSVLTIMLILLYMTSNRIVRPINDLTQIIKKMAAFQFNTHEYKDFDEYTSRKSEIGEISRAIKTMEENFLELKNKMEIMDEEINAITIEDQRAHQISLSGENPFTGIANSVNGLLTRVYSYIRQIRQYNEEIRYLAEHDALTSLPNRRKFHTSLHRELVSGTRGAVILLDMDNFKSINDSLGHVFGDKILQCVSEKLGTIDSSIFVSRFGGDEFLILQPIREKREELENCIKKIFALFNKSLVIDGNEVKIEFSMGISFFPDDSDNIDQIIMNADIALHHVKNSGKNNFAYFDQIMADHVQYRMNVKRILVKAIEECGFYMVYQPVVDLKTGRIKGYEALVRLKDHNIHPGDFIQIAEENALIIPLGRIVTRLVVEQLNTWDRLGLNPKRVSINFSALQINDIGYKAYLLDLLQENQVNPERLVIEITEHIFAENKEATIEFINDLRPHGIRFAIDDFGAEYSSLNYLAFLPIDILKIDKELSRQFLESEDPNVMKSLIAFIHTLKLQVVAEGIEETEQIKTLLEAGCDSVQGYYFSKPIEAEELEKDYDKSYTVLS